MTAERFLAALPMGLRTATVEDVRDAIVAATLGASTSTARQYTLRIKSLLSYGHELGYMPFNAGVRIKMQNDAGNRGASLAKRIMSPAEVALLICAAPSNRDRILIEVAYAGELRVSEIISLTWADVLPRENDLVQLSRSLARCCCLTSSVDRCSRCAATQAPMILCSRAAREAVSPNALY